MKKKVLAAVLCISLTVTLFVGCGSSNDVGSNKANTESNIIESKNENSETEIVETEVAEESGWELLDIYIDGTTFNIENCAPADMAKNFEVNEWWDNTPNSDTNQIFGKVYQERAQAVPYGYSVEYKVEDEKIYYLTMYRDRQSRGHKYDSTFVKLGKDVCLACNYAEVHAMWGEEHYFWKTEEFNVLKEYYVSPDNKYVVEIAYRGRSTNNESSENMNIRDDCYIASVNFFCNESGTLDMFEDLLVEGSEKQLSNYIRIDANGKVNLW